jgi:hypothetical protein
MFGLDTFKTDNPVTVAVGCFFVGCGLWILFELLSHGTVTLIGGFVIFGLAALMPIGLGVAIIHNQIRLRKHSSMTPDEARHLVIEGINYAAYHETDFSLHDSHKNRLFGSEHYESGRPVHEPSPWAEGDFEEKMAMLLVWANVLNRSVPAFTEAQKLLEDEDSVVGRIIRGAKNRKATDIAPGTKFGRSSA